MKNMIKKIAGGLAITCICWLVSGCGQNSHQSPDFTKEVTVKMKKSYEWGSLYFLQHDQGACGSGWGPVSFKAPTDFANVGDMIAFTNGCLRVN